LARTAIVVSLGWDLTLHALPFLTSTRPNPLVVTRPPPLGSVFGLAQPVARKAAKGEILGPRQPRPRLAEIPRVREAGDPGRGPSPCSDQRRLPPQTF